LWKVQRRVLRIVRAEEKESKNLFAVIRAEKKRVHSSLIAQLSSSSQRKMKRREKEEKKEVEASFEASILCV
jgi:hypothetical protein